jgi:DNA-binding transcriptional ArsR family regulator
MIVENKVGVNSESYDREIYRLQAEICRIMAEPVRLELLDHLKNGEHTVNELVEITGLRQANVSQHLAAMRQAGLVLTRRQATAIYYSLAYPEITQACEITRNILLSQLSDGRRLVAVSGGNRE